MGQHLLAALGSSFALVILGGLALNLLPVGLVASDWGSWLGGVTGAAALLALSRGHGRPLRLPRIPGRTALVPVALLVLAAVTAAAAGALAVENATVASQRAPSVDLWVLPAANQAGQRALTVGIDTYDAVGAQSYRLAVYVGGRLVDDLGMMVLARMRTGSVPSHCRSRLRTRRWPHNWWSSSCGGVATRQTSIATCRFG